MFSQMNLCDISDTQPPSRPGAISSAVTAQSPASKSPLVFGEASEDSVDSVTDTDGVNEVPAPPSLCLAFDIPTSTQDTVYSSQYSVQSSSCLSETAETELDTSVQHEVSSLVKMLVGKVASLSSRDPYVTETVDVTSDVEDRLPASCEESFCGLLSHRCEDSITSDYEKSAPKRNNCGNVRNVCNDVQAVVEELVAAVVSSSVPSLDEEARCVVQHLVEKASSEFDATLSDPDHSKCSVHGFPQ